MANFASPPPRDYLIMNGLKICLILLSVLLSSGAVVAQHTPKARAQKPKQPQTITVASGFQTVIDTSYLTPQVIVDSVFVPVKDTSYYVVDTTTVDTVWTAVNFRADSTKLDSILEAAVSADILPEYPGGDDSLKAFLIDHMKLRARHEIFETVYVEFDVFADGTTSNYEIVRGMEGVPHFRKDLLKALSAMPAWKPATLQGKPVSIRYQFSIKIRPQ